MLREYYDATDIHSTNIQWKLLYPTDAVAQLISLALYAIEIVSVIRVRYAYPIS